MFPKYPLKHNDFPYYFEYEKYIKPPWKSHFINKQILSFNEDVKKSFTETLLIGTDLTAKLSMEYLKYGFYILFRKKIP